MEKGVTLTKLTPTSQTTYNKMYNVSEYEGYENFTVDNFIVEVNSYTLTGYSYASTDGSRTTSNCIMDKYYNPSSGYFRLNGFAGEVTAVNYWWTGATLTVTVYLLH